MGWSWGSGSVRRHWGFGLKLRFGVCETPGTRAGVGGPGLRGGTGDPVWGWGLGSVRRHWGSGLELGFGVCEEALRIRAGVEVRGL